MTLILLGSPHPEGVSDRLGNAAAHGANTSSKVDIIAPRDYSFAFCKGCGVCLKTGKCVLPADGADLIFEALANAHLAILTAPVYFYALPGQLKAFIDRSQKFWRGMQPGHPVKEAAVIMVAGRHYGKELFRGSLLTLTWFLKPFGYSVTEKLLFRGLDSMKDLTQEHEQLAFQLGQKICQR